MSFLSGLQRKLFRKCSHAGADTGSASGEWARERAAGRSGGVCNSYFHSHCNDSAFSAMIMIG